MNTSELLAHPWFGTWMGAVIAVAVALLAHHLGGMVLMRVTRVAPVMSAMVKKARAPSKAVLILLALQTVWQAAPDVLHWIDPVRHMNGLLMIIATTWLVARMISGLAVGILERHPVDVEDNMGARRIHTLTRVLSRVGVTLVVVIGASMLLMTFPGARQVGTSMLASAGVVGLIAGLAAKPVFSNLIAGLQIALTQPIRLDDVLVVEGEWGRVDEISGSYVVLRLWDDRALIIPLQYFIEKPFQNWTRNNAHLTGSVFLYVDYGMPLAPLRTELERILRAAPEWDQRFFNLVVTDATEQTMQLRVLCTAESSGAAWDLRCRVREGMIDFMQREYPQWLPRIRIEGEAGVQATAQAATQAAAQQPEP
jgi:small-conductance mechanosensitive channel